MIEIWKYSHTYTIGRTKSKQVDCFYSSLGRLKKIFRDGKTEISRPKYKGRNGERIYVTVAKLFPEICGEWYEGCEVDHINTDRSDNRAENLRCVSAKENMNNPLTIEHCRGPKSFEHRKKLSDAKKRKPACNRKTVIMSDPETGEILNMFVSCAEAAGITGLSKGNIPNACNGKYHGSDICGGFRWSYIINNAKL